MKKILIALTIVISCLGISRVSADNLQLELYGYDDFIEFKSFFGEEEFTNIINDMIDEYKNNYYYSYPYFDIILSYSNISGVNHNTFTLNYYKEIPVTKWRFSYSAGIGFTAVNLILHNDSNFFQRAYYLENDILKYNNISISTPTAIISTRDGRNVPSYDNDGEWYRYQPFNYYYSNYDLILDSLSEYKNKYDSYFGSYNSAYLFNYDNFLIPKINEPTISTVVSYDRSDYVIEPYYLYDNNNISMFDYIEINLNDYAYVALALKDYQQDPFETSVQVKGQYCITPVYGMGLESYDDMTGTKIQNVCTPYYDNYTPVRTTITKDNIKNYSIYYVKSYDTTRDNYIKVDTSIFDITYITEEEKDNPYVLVQGKYYPTIPYDDLPSSATQNTYEGYIPGQSEEFSFTDIFTAPLDFLMEIWGTITTFFDLITSFISLLPPELQGFLFASFTLAIVLGLIKIIL